jgi:hypothetical protein
MTRKEEVAARVREALLAELADIAVTVTDSAIGQRVSWLGTLAAQGDDVAAMEKTRADLAGVPATAATIVAEDAKRLRAKAEEAGAIAKELRDHIAALAV